MMGPRGENTAIGKAAEKAGIGVSGAKFNFKLAKTT